MIGKKQVHKTEKQVLKILRGDVPERNPVWLMRQAGRYLPEYRDIRSKAKNFLNMCMSSDWASEITLQPIRRYGFDAAILFADILLIPFALGLDLEFREGEGPVLEKLSGEASVTSLDFDGSKLLPIYDTVRKTKAQLDNKTTLIGFCGSPWTVACYMIDGNSKSHFFEAKKWKTETPHLLDKLIATLVDASEIYLAHQIEAGAEVVQLFDSWSGLLQGGDFARFVIQPTKELVRRLKAKHPNVPIIGFPREAGEGYQPYVRETGVDALSIDQHVDIDFARRELQSIKPLQGNLDPELLIKGGKEMREAVENILRTFGKRHIVNLGHGIDKTTPLANVQELVKIVPGLWHMKIAIILFNLGGPDRVEAVKPFLFNLFNDPAIIRLPKLFRIMIARLISSRRENIAIEIYKKIGGASPLLRNTQFQAAHLENVLEKYLPEHQMKCFVAMRYWHPLVAETFEDVRDYAPDEIILLPLYPQYSTTTSASSFKSWDEMVHDKNYTVTTKKICCYPDDPHFIQSLALLTRSAYDEAAKKGRPRILLSAHGLPKKIVRQGDPYVWQCERSAKALIEKLGIADVDWVLCYQSRVGPMEWIGPSTDKEIRRAGADKVPVVVVPIAFVSEHSETLVEIDIEYRHLAETCGVPFYIYSGTVATSADFIDGLTGLVQKAFIAPSNCVSSGPGRICPADKSGCCQKGF